MIALGLAGEFWLALVALLAVGAAGLVFQTTTQSLMLSLSDVDYHGRMQSMVVLGFSGFGLAALPLGLLADAVTLEVTIVAMGVVVLAVTAAFARKRSAAPPTRRRGRVHLTTTESGGRVSWSTRRRGSWRPTARRCGRPRCAGSSAT